MVGASNTNRSGSSRPVFCCQAEDGIRDIGVTGVQTCALPISRYDGARPLRYEVWLDGSEGMDAAARGEVSVAEGGFAQLRSEERRVGKECRSRWSPYH